MEGNKESLSSSEDNIDVTDGENSSVSCDSCSREIVKPKISQEGTGSGNKEKLPEDGESSDEEVCSVCEVWNIIMSWK